MNKLDNVSGRWPDTGTTVVAFPKQRKAKDRSALVLDRRTAKKLTCPPGKSDHLYRDSIVSGFILRAYATGKKVWLVQYRNVHGVTRRVNIGDANVVEADKARQMAKDILAEVRRGNDPAARRDTDRKALKFAVVVEDYIAYFQGRVDAGKRKASTLTEIRRGLQHCSAFDTAPLKAIGRADIAALHKRLSDNNGKIVANRVLMALSGFFAWAIGQGLADNNPVIGIAKNDEVARERVLSDDELRTIWQATSSNNDFDRIVRLLLLTGCRRSEVGDMQRHEIAGDLWVIPKERMKNGQPHEVPLTRVALECVPKDEGPFVFGREENTGFSGWSKGKARLDRKIGFDDWSLHDMRRTLSTRLHEAGIQPHVIESLLAHISGHKAGVAGVYNRATYREQKREALELWASMIAEIVE